jgi:hypothetical protein
VIANLGTLVPDRAVPNAPEAPATCSNVRIKHLSYSVSTSEVDVPDNTFGDLGFSIDAGRTHGGDAVDGFGFANTSEFFRPIRSKEHAAFHEYGRDHIVATDVFKHFIDQISLLEPSPGLIPKMMMRVANGNFRLNHRLGNEIQPCLIS